MKAIKVNFNILPPNRKRFISDYLKDKDAIVGLNPIPNSKIWEAITLRSALKSVFKNRLNYHAISNPQIFGNPPKPKP